MKTARKQTAKRPRTTNKDTRRDTAAASIDDQSPMAWNDKLRRLLRANGTSQATLGAQAEVKTRRLAYYVSGDRTPTVDVAMRIAHALDVDPSWLFDDTLPWSAKRPYPTNEIAPAPALRITIPPRSKGVGASISHAEKLKRLMAESGISQADLSSMAARIQPRVALFGDSDLNRKLAASIAIAEVFGVDAGWLLDDTQPWEARHASHNATEFAVELDGRK